MSYRENGGPAFPCDNRSGMTLRDYFAAQAMAGMLADPAVTIGGDASTIVARSAYGMADAMLMVRDENFDDDED